MLDKDLYARVVDLGCGDGTFSVKVMERIGCKEMWGIDIDAESLRKANSRGLIVGKADLSSALPLKAESFDVVVSNQVIEHLFRPVNFLTEVYRILKPNGYVVISTENLSSWDNIAALVLGYTPFSMEFDGGLRKIGNPFSPHEKEFKYGYVHSHVRVFAWNGLMELAKLLRFKSEWVSGSGHLLGRFGEIVDKKHCRFITFRLRKRVSCD
jgi:ubiquinone/menaquinone biosynthesis C-methylase UbiE